MRSAEQMAASWFENSKSTQARTKWEQRMEALTVAPTELAATDNAMKAYEDGVMRSIRSGYRQKRLLASSLASYKAACKAKSNRLGDLKEESKRKYLQQLQVFLPVYADIHQTAAAMPSGGEANALAKVAMSRRKLMIAAGKDPS